MWKNESIQSCLVFVSLTLFSPPASRNIGDWWLAYWISHSRTENHLNSTMACHLRHVIPSGLTADQFGQRIHIVKDTVTFYLVVYGGLAVANSVKLFSFNCTKFILYFSLSDMYLGFSYC